MPTPSRRGFCPRSRSDPDRRWSWERYDRLARQTLFGMTRYLGQIDAGDRLETTIRLTVEGDYRKAGPVCMMERYHSSQQHLRDYTFFRRTQYDYCVKLYYARSDTYNMVVTDHQAIIALYGYK